MNFFDNSYRFERRKLLRGIFFGVGVAALGRLANADRLRSGGKFFITIRLIADTIIPKTSTPGASDVDAHIFVLELVSKAKTLSFQARFYQGLDDLMNASYERYGVSFEHLSSVAREAFLRDVLEEKVDAGAHWFLSRFKKLVLLGWALSERSAEAAFSYTGGFYQYLPRTNSHQIIAGNYIDKEYLSL